MPEPLLPPEALGPEQAEAIRNFLLRLAEEPDLLVEYIRDRVSILKNESGLGEEAQALLLESNYTRVHQVMKQSSTPARWVCIWVI